MPVHDRDNVFRDLFKTYKNPYFLSYLGATCIAMTGGGFVQMGLPYLTRVLVREGGIIGDNDESVAWVGWLGLISTAGTFISAPFFSKMVPLIGKKRMLIAGIGINACVIATIAGIVWGSDPALAVILMQGVSSLVVSAVFIIPPVLLGQIVDWDEQATGDRKEGIYTGANAFTQKICFGLAMVVTTYLTTNYSVTAEDPTAVTIIYAIASALGFIGIAVVSFFPSK